MLVPRVLAAGDLDDRGITSLVTERVAGADLHERFTVLDADEAAAFNRERITAMLERLA